MLNFVCSGGIRMNLIYNTPVEFCKIVKVVRQRMHLPVCAMALSECRVTLLSEKSRSQSSSLQILDALDPFRVFKLSSERQFCDQAYASCDNTVFLLTIVER
jgi:hypothetical protein